MHRSLQKTVFGLLIIALALVPGCLPQRSDPSLQDAISGEGDENQIIRINPRSNHRLEGEWNDFFLRMAIHREAEGELGISFRANGEEGAYFLLMSADGFRLQREKQGKLEELAINEMRLEAIDWHPIGIEMIGGEIRAFYRDEMVIEFVDPEPLPHGPIAFETLGDLQVEIIDLFVEVIGEKAGINGQSNAAEASEPEPETPAQISEDEQPINLKPGTPVSELAPRLDTSELEWVRLGGPAGGTGYDIRYNFDDPSIWYATDANSGVHISTDNGITWEESNEGILGQSGLTNDAKGVFCLTVDPHDPQTIWIGTIGHGHIYRSTDGGLTWEKRDNGVTLEFDQLSFRGFTVDPRTSDIVYAMGETNDESLGGPRPWKGGVGGVIYKTTDAGENWIKIWDGGMPSSLARYMWIDPDDADVLYVSTGIFDRSAVGEAESEDDPLGGLGILKSTDGGETWRILGKENGLRNLYIGSLFMHPENADVLLAGAGHLGGPEAETYWRRFADAGEPLPTGVYRTEDGGETWVQTLATDDPEEITSVELCPSDPNIGYASGRFSMYRTSDAGKSWEITAKPWSPPGIAAGWPIDMQCDPANVDRIFINNYGGGNYVSTDGGKSWTSASNGYTGAQVFELDLDPDYPTRIYAKTYSGLWRSDDAGENWAGILDDSEDIRGIRFIAVDPEDSSHIFTGQSQIITSQTGSYPYEIKWDMREALGDAVNEEAAVRGVPTMVYAPSDPQRMYAGYSQELCKSAHEPGCMNDNPFEGPGLIVSRDGGETWDVSAGSGLNRKDIRDVAVDPQNADIVYVSTENGVLRTINAGDTWTELPLPTESASAYAIAIDPANPSRILVGIDRDSIYKSEDGGATWQNAGAGMEPNSSLSEIIFDPVNIGTVYASDLLSGVYQSKDSGSTWTKINTGLHSRAIADIVISANGNHIYAGSHEDGVYRLDLNGVPPELATE